MTDVLVVAYEVERVVFRLVLLALVVKLVSEAWGAWRARRRQHVHDEPAEPPFVTVQLPIRNERYVAERVIRAAAQLDYPAFEIQVLDDSDDETVKIVDDVVAELAARGTTITIVRRASRDGAKAGALANGMRSARGEYVALFDADFVPGVDFLRRAMPAFRDDRVGMVQGRWEFLDRGESVLTEAQAMLLDGLMLVEQPAKHARGQPLHFNGTAGVWRRACIEDAGGWRAESITEDLELSGRAARRGWRLVHLAELAVPTELPSTMRAYRSQQKRWSRGNAQVLRRAWWQIVRCELPVRHRLAMLMRPAARLLYVFLAILTFAMPLTTFGVIDWRVHYDIVTDAAIFATVVAALYAFYLPAHVRATGSLWRGVALVPVVMALHVGLSLACAIAFVAGLAVRGAEFVRTPKHGGGRRAASYQLPLDPVALVEIVIGFAYVTFAAIAVEAGLYPTALFFAFWAIAHLWVGTATVTGAGSIECEPAEHRLDLARALPLRSRRRAGRV